MIFLVLLALALAYLSPRVLAQPPAILGRLPLLAPVSPSVLTPPAPWRAATVHPTGSGRATLALGRAEIRRLLRSPLFLAALALALITAAAPGERTEFTMFNDFALGGPAALWCGLVCYFAGNLAATRARRGGVTEMLAPTPLSMRGHVLALALAGVAAFAVFLVVFLAGYVYWWDIRDVAITRPTIWHVMSTPMQVLGGFTLGVLVGTWAPWRGVAPAGFFALVTAHFALADHGAVAWGAYIEYARWPDQGGGFLTMSPAWHLLYMGLLSAMAVVGALVWLPGPRRGLLVLGAALTLAAAAAGVAQLP